MSKKKKKPSKIEMKRSLGLVKRSIIITEWGLGSFSVMITNQDISGRSVNSILLDRKQAKRAAAFLRSM